MKTGEGNHVHGELAEIAVKLAGESEARGGSANGGRYQVVKVTVGRGGELQGTEADVVKSLVIEGEALIGVLHKLVNGQGTVIGLHNGIRHLGGGNDGEGGHNSIGVLLSDLGDQKCAHAGSSSTTHGVGHLESLEAIAGLGLLSHNVKNRIDELGTLGVVTLGPIVSGSGLAENEVIGAEELAEGTGTDGVHGSGLKIHENGSGHISATSGLVKVHTDALELKIGVTVVSTGGIDALK
jgi:hypothetical protein